MRVLVVDTYYQAVLDQLYASRPGLSEAPFEQQHAAVMGLRFGTSDAYSHALRAAGHPAAEVVPNAEPLQRAWARERGGAALRTTLRLGADWRRRILLEQIREFAPDVVYFQDLTALAPRDLAQMSGRGIVVAGQIASAAPGPEVVRAFDIIFTSFPHFVERFAALDVEAHFLPIAFDARVLDDLAREGIATAPGGERAHPLSFVGSVDPRVHPERVTVLESVSERVDLDIWGYGEDGLHPDSPLRARFRGQAWGMDMYRVLASSEILINRHIPAAEGFANNMRLFEATGVGAALVTEEAPNLGQYFERDREVAGYAGDAAAVDVIEGLLGDADRRRSIAAAGQQRTLRDHTYDRRVAEMVEALGRAIA